MITLQHINKSYGKKQVLHDINLAFEPGHVYGIAGENGAGKTTLFRCIAGLESHSGTILSPYPNLKNHLGYLETNPVFMPFITGWEYLKLLCKAKNIKTNNFEEQNIFNLPLDQYANTYSTGMKKKLALMGLLLRKNDIIILDEPFNGVDIQSNMIITEIIHTLKIHRKTILISSHIFSTLRDTCDQIILLTKGRIGRQVQEKEYQALESSMKENIRNTNTKKIIIE
ncbi:MAG: ABC transporter ATP-binding protein [Saprospiraceae bacterium]|nr:ABC transporter ATP-binding protein [Saprospiraceae bacterium]